MFDVIGDIHSCFEELKLLLIKLDYNWCPEKFIMVPPKGRKVIFVGDLMDRGWFPATTFQLIENMVKEDYAQIVKGNHDDKLIRWANGRNVIQSHGLDDTIIKLQRAQITKERINKLYENAPFFFSPNSNLVVVHAAWKDKYINRDPFDKHIRSRCIFGPTTGRTINGFPERIDWAKDREEKTPIVIHGHNVIEEVCNVNGVFNIDTGCVFGGFLTALKYPEMEIVQIRAKFNYCKR